MATRFFSHFHYLVNIFCSWLIQVSRLLVLVILVVYSYYVLRQGKCKYREILDKKSSKFVYRRQPWTLLLRLVIAKDEEEVEMLDCAICLLEFEHGDKGRKLESCSHIFHDECLEKWLIHGKGQATCPLCRSVVIIIPQDMVLEEHHKIIEDDTEHRTNIFEEELALLLLSGLTSTGCCTR
ncbi:RING-H2 finger protein ATL2-like [Nicotiana sylvestris]|uniref:RING-H2 finger protein ATL2-like n=2 Tax=Nicotiana TaxID=4085 RepID=A0A1S4CPW4_TOBAC|nr:PREDICTED: RING-H2 finger protein ATL2-like [Nicotiana sylvestris]XP_016503105.1 PREDICTED: RING-H2 finger protein ATL2-like [Nicotiana tabacum]